MQEINTMSVSDATTSQSHLKRTLNSSNLVMMGIGCIVGAGLFSLVGVVAAESTGPAIIISFALAAVACFFSALCYSEFSAMVPLAGSAYSYTKYTMSEFLAFIIGWDLVLEYALGAATVAVSWSQYLVRFLQSFGLYLPPKLIMSPFETVTLADGTIVRGYFNCPAAIIIIGITLLLVRGITLTSFVNNILVTIKFLVIFIFIAIGFFYINPINHVPFIPENTGVFGEYGWSGIFRGAAVLFFAFLGFDALSTTAQEVKNPQKALPRAIMLALLICTVIYVVFSWILTGMANYKEFSGNAAPISVAIMKTPFLWLQSGVTIAILVGFMSVIIVQLMAQTRVFYAMSEDKLLPKTFSDIHPKYQTPYKSHMVFALAVTLLAGFVPVAELGHMVSIGTLLSFVIVSISVIILRKTKPDLKRPFKVPLVPLIPILGTLICIALMLALPYQTWLRLIIWMIIGLIIYVSYSRRAKKK